MPFGRLDVSRVFISARKFTAAYQHRLVRGGIGHNLPQEAPGALHGQSKTWMRWQVEDIVTEGARLS